MTPRDTESNNTETVDALPDGTAPHRILIFGGGFGGVHLARELERLFAERSDVDITLVSRDNFFLLTPL
ncbi:MAG TPA: hypothetical protein VG963_21100, partial [Polyangiaceae bacterium]|nr:hypothetical protein [Polyangiaceae bacterium]